ncbi:FAD/NAD(P)-binding domain-containing protein [Aspergillus ellipticus CBS 707.79]|uniref:FAD/NAD(P)-binding domain-containing protein n=1 Tax=Aspergillus ellipticus CBS 707.79 TaxID=1448320 RepID=A0A319E3W8_9EURO|nr:FAD/NAD(P)-binding domain-containing protein [Aspergillus ellipticus CBS 707.79]
MATDPIEVAIVGAGITGITLALGLRARNIRVRIFERARDLHEIGAGIGFTPNAEWAMRVVDPRIHAAFKRVATPNASDWFQWVDGFHEAGTDPRETEEPLLFKIYLGERGFEGCHRAEFLGELARLLPEGTVVFQKSLETVETLEDGAQVLRFQDGSTARAHAVIGCDGIRSRMRRLLLSEDHPGASAHYSHKYAARGLIPMDRAREALGEAKVATRLMHLGPDAHALTFPVAQGSLLNVVAFVTDPRPWPHADRLTAPGRKADVAAAFAGFGPTMRTIIDLLPDPIDQWAVFDLYDHPPETYARGNLCIAGDAAHAAAPHHGAGAGCGIEDAAVLCAVLEMATQRMAAATSQEKAALTRVALETYDAIRRERAQWLVDSSRAIGNLYEWQDAQAGSDAAKCHDEAFWRSHRIWDYDIGAMMQQTATVFEARAAAVTKGSDVKE